MAKICRKKNGQFKRCRKSRSKSRRRKSRSKTRRRKSRSRWHALVMRKYRSLKGPAGDRLSRAMKAAKKSYRRSDELEYY